VKARVFPTRADGSLPDHNNDNWSFLDFDKSEQFNLYGPNINGVVELGFGGEECFINVPWIFPECSLNVP
jgi:hypothetical protein